MGWKKCFRVGGKIFWDDGVAKKYVEYGGKKLGWGGKKIWGAGCNKVWGLERKKFGTAKEFWS